jgi:predicted ribosomally synthesized six-cysteine peptide SCIFF
MAKVHIHTINKENLARTLKTGGCGECQTSCQSACKTSCTVSNQGCQKQK